MSDGEYSQNLFENNHYILQYIFMTVVGQKWHISHLFAIDFFLFIFFVPDKYLLRFLDILDIFVGPYDLCDANGIQKKKMNGKKLIWNKIKENFGEKCYLIEALFV